LSARHVWPVVLIALVLPACKSKAPTGNTPSSAKPAAVATGKGQAVLGGKVTITSAEVGAPTTLNAWLFGPLGTAKSSDLGVASAVSADGTYSFPAVAPGSYHLQFGHTWSSPQTTVGKDGIALRALDYPVKITPNNLAAKDDGLATDGVTTVTIASGTTSLPPVTVTAEPFPSTWDTKGFVPAPGQALPNQASVEFNLVGHPAAREVGLVVHAGAGGKGAEVFSGKSVSGHLLWRGVTPGSYSYQATSYLVSSKTLTSGWIDFTVGTPAP
jgi:hypothetical protein